METIKQVVCELRRRKACGEAIDYVKSFDSWQACWDQCERADWMAWILGALCKPEDSQEIEKGAACMRECQVVAMEYQTEVQACLSAIDAEGQWPAAQRVFYEAGGPTRRTILKRSASVIREFCPQAPSFVAKGE